MAIHAQRTLATAALLAALSLPASAQLGIRLEPELDDPGTSALPARLGYARSNGEAGAALQMAIVYDLRPTMPLPDRARSGAEPVDRLQLKRGLGHTDGAPGRFIRPKLGLYYLLFNHIDPPKGRPLFSLTLNRSLGADPLDGSPAKKSSTGLYLGMKL